MRNGPTSVRFECVAFMVFITLVCVASPFRVIGQITSQPRLLTQSAPIAALPPKGKRWALVIGVDKYRDGQIGTLNGGVNDAHNLADALVRYAGFPSDQVILLATDQPEERQPTRLNILRRLSNLTGLIPKDGLLFVSFSGHGIERGGQAFLIPTDAQLSDDVEFLEQSAVSVNYIHSRIKAAGVAQVLVLLDACRNDPGGRADAPNPLSSAYTRGFSFDVANREVQAYATLYATAVGQRAYEYSEKKQGYFSWAVVSAFQGAAANEKGEVTLSALVRYVEEVVPKRVAIDLGTGKRQIPFHTIDGYRAEELVIAMVPVPLPGGDTGTPAPLISPVDSGAIELSFWESIKNSTDPADFQAYLDKYGEGGRFSPLAHNRLTQINLRSKPAGTDPALAPEGNASKWVPIKIRVVGDNTTNGWTSTGYVVRKGQRLRITATGRVMLGQGRSATPAGISSLPDPSKLMPSEPTGAIIAVIGDDNNDFIFIGSRREFVANRSGYLFLGVNENYLEDNKGAFDAILEVEYK